MISVVTRSSLLYNRREVWFYGGGPHASASNTVFYQATTLPEGAVERVETFTTTSLDLARGLDDLLGGVHKTTRYDIRKGEQLGISTEALQRPPASSVEAFVNGHHDFARDRGLLGIEHQRVRRLSDAGHFTITRALFEGRVLATHGYVHDETRSRLLISYGSKAVETSALRGYANKLLHWKDIAHFHAAGLTIYDFGGIDPEAATGRSRFKVSFGGYRESSNNCVLRRGLYGAIARRRDKKAPLSAGSQMGRRET